MKKIIQQTVELCNDCPFCDAMSIDCKAYAWCNKESKPLPAHEKQGLEIMVMEIPDWCPLENDPDNTPGALKAAIQ